MSNLHLVTGYAGQAHVTAADDGSFNRAIFGGGQYVLDLGSKLAASVVSNNKITIADGDLLMQGRHIRLNEGTTVDLTISNGAQGKLRNDLIVARYTKDSVSGVEEVNLVVIQGTAVDSNPVDPAYTSGDIINDHALLNDMPLYRVPLNGLTVGTPVALFSLASIQISDGTVTTAKLASGLVVPIGKGGTGATTAAAARTNLGLSYTNFGDFNGKTISDLQAALDEWLDSCRMIPGASAMFSASSNWVTFWNNNDTSSTVSSGGWCTATVVAPYSGNSNFLVLRICHYGGNQRFVVTKNNGVWGSIDTLMTSANIAAYTHPVGSIYLSVSSTSPASLFGGTWERLKDRFLLAAGGSYSAGATGGEASHTLTTSEMPVHGHKIYLKSSSGTKTAEQWSIYIPEGYWNQVWQDGGASGFILESIEYAGGGSAHNNMPPYLAVYVWKRTA